MAYRYKNPVLPFNSNKTKQSTNLHTPQEDVGSSFINFSPVISINPFSKMKSQVKRPHKIRSSKLFNDDYCCVKESTASFQFNISRRMPKVMTTKLGLKQIDEVNYEIDIRSKGNNSFKNQENILKRYSSCEPRQKKIYYPVSNSNQTINQVKISKSLVNYLKHKIIAKGLLDLTTFKEYLSYLLLSKRIYSKKRLNKKIYCMLMTKVISTKIRKEYWVAQCNIHRTMAESIHDYQFYCSKECKLVSDIDKDADRTFPEDHYFYNKQNNIINLRKVLKAFAVKNPDIGYTQGLNSIAGNLLLKFPDDVILLKYNRWLFGY